MLRRKMLVNSLTEAGFATQDVYSAMSFLGLDKNIRGEELTVEQFKRFLLVSSQFKSYAKINWDLYVFPKSGDSPLHQIDSIVAIIDLFDEITLEITDGSGIDVFCDVAPGEKNIVWKALTLFFQHSGIQKKVTVKIEKNIPHGAGLGGGSSNAMFTILELIKLLDINISDSEIIDIAKKVGSDLPIFMNSGWMRISGTGELIEKLSFPQKKLVLFKPEKSLSTKDVYDEFDMNPVSIVVPEIQKRIQKPHNSLFDAAKNLLPELTKIITNIVRTGLFKTVSMTGSGSTIFAEPIEDIFPDQSVIRELNLEYYQTKTICF
ncbi:MAG: hypothetical protein R2883_01775 [Caldisericia bacterium]